MTICTTLGRTPPRTTLRYLALVSALALLITLGLLLTPRADLPPRNCLNPAARPLLPRDTDAIAPHYPSPPGLHAARPSAL